MDLKGILRIDNPETNQKAVDLIYEYLDTTEPEVYDPKSILKYLRNRGYAIAQVGDGQKDYL